MAGAGAAGEGLPCVYTEWAMSPDVARRYAVAVRIPPPPPGWVPSVVHGQEFERVAYVRALTGGRAQVRAGRCEGVAHRGIDAAVTSLRRDCYWPMEGVRGPRRFRLEWSHDMHQY